VKFVLKQKREYFKSCNSLSIRQFAFRGLLPNNFSLDFDPVEDVPAHRRGLG